MTQPTHIVNYSMTYNNLTKLPNLATSYAEAITSRQLTIPIAALIIVIGSKVCIVK